MNQSIFPSSQDTLQAQKQIVHSHITHTTEVAGTWVEFAFNIQKMFPLIWDVDCADPFFIFIRFQNERMC